MYVETGEDPTELIFDEKIGLSSSLAETSPLNNSIFINIENDTESNANIERSFKEIIESISRPFMSRTSIAKLLETSKSSIILNLQADFSGS